MKREHISQYEEALLIQLGSLLEAGGSVQAVVGRVLRWGLGVFDVHGETNREGLLRDLDDLKAAIKRVEKTLAPVSAPLSSPKVGEQLERQLERLTQATEQAVASDLAAASIELGPVAEASSGRVPK